VAVTIVIIFSAVGAGIGVTGLVTALRGKLASGTGLGRRRRPERKASSWPAKVGPPLIGGLVVGLFTRWPVAALLAGVAIAALPTALRTTSSRNSIRRTEAVAVWAELLRDTLTSSAGLAQAIVATSGLVPEELRIPAANLADRIMSGVGMDDALRAFATEIDNPSGEDVVQALRLAATTRAPRLVDLLGALAESTRDEVTMRLRVEANRAAARSSVRTVIVFSVGFVALLTLVARSYLAPFGSVTGQLVLIVVGACYAAGVKLMIRLVRPSPWSRASGEGLRI
jgi:tight adherence protein B